MNTGFLKLRNLLLLTPVLILAAALFWLLTTSSGFQFALNNALKLSGTNVEFDNLQGTFAGDIKADRLTYLDDSTTVNIEDFSTRLNLFWLLDARVAFTETRIKNISVTLKETRNTKEDTGPVNLPLGFSFDSTSIESLNISDNDSPLIHFTNINAKNMDLGEYFEFEKLAFEFPQGAVEISGDVELTKELEVDLVADWRLNNTETMPAIAGRSRLEGNLKKISTETTVSQPSAAVINAEAKDIANTLTWRATVKSPSIDTATITTNINTKLENTTANIFGNKESANISLETTLRDPDFGAWHAVSQTEVNISQWKVASLVLQSLDSPTKIDAQIFSKGTAPYSAETGVEITANWQQLQWPLKGNAEYISDSGNASIVGTLNAYALKASGNFSFSDYRFSDVSIAGTGTQLNMQYSSVATRYLEGQWNGTASIDWSKGFAWSADLDVDDANPGVQWPDLSGKLAGKVSGKGSHQKDGWTINGDIQKLSGSFRSYPVKGKSLFAVSEKEYSFNKLNLRSGENTIAGNIAIRNYLSDGNTQIKANWDIDAKDLTQLKPEIKGAVSSKGKLTGKIAAPSIDGKLQAKNFRYLGYGVGTADIKAMANLQEDAKLQVNASLRDALAKDIPINEINLVIDGSTRKHKIEINGGIKENNNFQLLAESGYSDNGWAGKLKGLDITTDKYGQWFLPFPSVFAVSDTQWHIDNACLSFKAQPASACFVLSSNTQTDSYRLNGELKTIPFSLFQKSMPEFVTELEGVLNGNASLVIDKDKISDFSLSLKSEGGKLTHNILNKTPETIVFKNLAVTGNQKKQDIELTAHADLQETGIAVVKFTLPKLNTLSGFSADQPIDGLVNIELKDLSPFQAFIPEVHSIEGATSSNFHISGTFNKPVLTGESSLTASKITLPQVGLALKDTQLKAHSTKSKSLVFEGVTHSGDGHLNIKGDIPDYNAENILVKLDARGKQFLAVKTPDVEMELSPEFLLILENNAVNVNGSVNIDRAQISLLDTFGGLSPSSDVVIVDPQVKLAKETPLVLSGQIRLKLSDRIFVQGAGFVGRVTGELLITETPGDVTRATGELIIRDGRYSSPVKGDNIPGLLISIAQKELIIDEGRLIFAASPIDNPRLDIRARRPTSNVVTAGVDTKITVGVDIKGHVNNPQITLYSEPAMDQADILAYLTLGYPLTEASKNDGQYLARIASSIGLVGGEKLAKGIAKEFGIDEVYIQSEDTTQQAQLVLGKYLSPKLYVRYAVGIGEAVDTLQIQYKLTDRWMLRTESAVTKQGTDLIYTIEKD